MIDDFAVSVHKSSISNLKLDFMKRFAFVALLAAIACSSHSPTAPSANGGPCVDVSGTYSVTYQSACASEYPKQWVIQQSGCDIHTQIVPDTPILSGSVKGTTVQIVMHNGFTNCLYDLAGDGQFDGQSIRAQVAGKVSGPCCGDRTDMVSIVAVRTGG